MIIIFLTSKLLAKPFFSVEQTVYSADYLQHYPKLRDNMRVASKLYHNKYNVCPKCEQDALIEISLS